MWARGERDAWPESMDAGGRFQEPRWAESRRGVDRPGRLEISRRRTPSGGMEG